MITPSTHWRTKDGTLIALADMEDSHLQNSVNMLDKSIENLDKRLAHAKKERIKLQVEKHTRQNAKYQKALAAKKAAKMVAFLAPKQENTRRFRA